MCGICGIIDYNRSTTVSNPLIGRMCARMEHRGPDDEGIYVNGQRTAGLGHRRLSIIDLSGAGHQPMSNEDGTVWIVLNGEIYNYLELKVDLEGKGHIFRSNSDTETVIHLYETYGVDCLKYLRGMFAFAIWDEKAETLFLARDRVGKKPLIYHYEGNRFCFASEFSALLESGFVKKELNKEAIRYYLTYGYVPAPLTIYKKAFKLPPAHTLILRRGKVDISRYWQLNYSDKLNISEEDAASEVMKLLKEAVKVRLHSDVPLGAFLSGGIDSSAVVALMSQLSANKVKTFSVGFEERDYSELIYAKAIAKRFDTDHHEFIVKPKALDILPMLVERYGEPYADSSCIPSYYVSLETRRFVTVALNGDGGDESFAGYERYQAMAASERYRKMPRLARSLAGAIARISPDSINPKDTLRRIRRFFEAADMPTVERYLRWIGISGGVLDKDLYSEEFLRDTAMAEPKRFIEPYLGNSGGLDSLLLTDINTYLPNDLLVKMDIASMANSLEARSPFLDHKMMEFAARLPAGYKIKGLTKKYILKKAVSGLIPDNNINRSKMGFGVPVGNWFRGELKDLLRETLLSETALKRRYFKPETIRLMVEGHISGCRDYSFQLWALLMLELWHKKFLD